MCSLRSQVCNMIHALLGRCLSVPARLWPLLARGGVAGHHGDMCMWRRGGGLIYNGPWLASTPLLLLAPSQYSYYRALAHPWCVWVCDTCASPGGGGGPPLAAHIHADGGVQPLLRVWVGKGTYYQGYPGAFACSNRRGKRHLHTTPSADGWGLLLLCPLAASLADLCSPCPSPSPRCE